MNPALAKSFDDLDQGRMDIDQFISLWRAQDALVAQLPPRYAEVLDQLLVRLESSRLFTGDSCSFSNKELLDSLKVWLDKATAKIADGS